MRPAGTGRPLAQPILPNGVGFLILDVGGVKGKEIASRPVPPALRVTL